MIASAFKHAGACRKPKKGSRQRKIRGGGFQDPRQGLVPVCINPECAQGQQNIAEQKTLTRKLQDLSWYGKGMLIAIQY